MKTIFVSSTFRDMHYERDIIQRKVLPQLNEIARKCGETIMFRDLRWGVNTGNLDNETSMKKVLRVCLHEIDRCKPYMIVILGNCYGSKVKGDLLKSIIKERNDVNLEKTLLSKKVLSITGLEIEYGALSNKDDQMDRTLFYFRKIKGEAPSCDYYPVDEDEQKRVEELKESIQKCNGNWKEYEVEWRQEDNSFSGLDEFQRMVVEDITKLMNDEWSTNYASLTDIELDQKYQWDYANQKATQFTAKEKTICECIKIIKRDKVNVAIYGDHGCGKTTFMGSLAVNLRKQGCNVMPIFVGLTPKVDSSFDVLNAMIEFMEKKSDHKKDANTDKVELSQKSTLEEKLKESIKFWSKKNKKKMLVFLIDAIDQLIYNEKLHFESIFQNVENVKVVVSSSEIIPYGFSLVDLGSLDNVAKDKIIKKNLIYLGKELDDVVVQELLKKSNSWNPLYLSMLLQRLLMMDRLDFDEINKSSNYAISNQNLFRTHIVKTYQDALNEYQIDIIKSCPDSIDKLCVEIIDVASKYIDQEFIQLALSCIAASQFGLREIDLREIFTRHGVKWATIDFSLLINYLENFFVCHNDGSYTFSHLSIRECYANSIPNKKEIHQLLLSYLKTISNNDIVKQREYVYQCMMCNNYNAFIMYMKDIFSDSTSIFGKPFANGVERACAGLHARKSAAHTIIYTDINNNGDWMLSLVKGAYNSNILNENNKKYLKPIVFIKKFLDKSCHEEILWGNLSEISMLSFFLIRDVYELLNINEIDYRVVSLISEIYDSNLDIIKKLHKRQPLQNYKERLAENFSISSKIYFRLAYQDRDVAPIESMKKTAISMGCEALSLYKELHEKYGNMNGIEEKIVGLFNDLGHSDKALDFAYKIATSDFHDKLVPEEDQYLSNDISIEHKEMIVESCIQSVDDAVIGNIHDVLSSKDLRKILSDCEKAVKIIESIADPTYYMKEPFLVDLYQRMSVLYQTVDEEKGLSYLKNALKICRHISNMDSNSVTDNMLYEVLKLSAMVYAYKKVSDERFSVKKYTEALNIKKKIFMHSQMRESDLQNRIGDDVDVINSYLHLAILLKHQKSAESHDWYQSAVNIKTFFDDKVNIDDEYRLLFGLYDMLLIICKKRILDLEHHMDMLENGTDERVQMHIHELYLLSNHYFLYALKALDPRRVRQHTVATFHFLTKDIQYIFKYVTKEESDNIIEEYVQLMGCGYDSLGATFIGVNFIKNKMKSWLMEKIRNKLKRMYFLYQITSV